MLTLMSDEDLLATEAAARQSAHKAPFCEHSKHHDGTWHLAQHTDAWARHSSEWMRLADEVDRRGLTSRSVALPLR